MSYVDTKKTLNVLWNGGENMNLYFQLLSSLPTRFLESWDPKLKLRRFFLGYDIDEFENM
jgi:hypothetical protein